MRISDWSSDVCSSDLALRLPEQGLRLPDLRLQRFEHGQWQRLQVARFVDERGRLVLKLPDLVVDLLKRARSGQDVLGIVARVEHHAAELGTGSGRQHGADADRENRGTGSQHRDEFTGVHGHYSWGWSGKGDRKSTRLNSSH